MANKMQYLQCSWILSNDLKHSEASFSTISTDILYSDAWISRSGNFCADDNTDDDRVKSRFFANNVTV